MRRVTKEEAERAVASIWGVPQWDGSDELMWEFDLSSTVIALTDELEAMERRALAVEEDRDRLRAELGRRARLEALRGSQ